MAVDADPPFEVTFFLVTGRQIQSSVSAEDLLTKAEIRPKAKDRESLRSALIANLASAMENDHNWAASSGSSDWLFRPGALIAIEIRDPMTPDAPRAFCFRVPAPTTPE